MNFFSRLSRNSRLFKLALFHRIFRPAEHMRILDVGAETHPDGDRGLQLVDSYSWKPRITAVNLSKEHICLIRKRYPQVKAVVGDACNLPFDDKHFDIVYSNAVIEHVGDFARQKRMAEEIMRVGKRWFVTTPNRWYPFELHLRLPLVRWLSGEAYLNATPFVRYNHVHRRYTFANPEADFRLMSSKEMQSCFPQSRIVKQRITFMAETLIAVGGTSANSGGDINDSFQTT